MIIHKTKLFWHLVPPICLLLFWLARFETTFWHYSGFMVICNISWILIYLDTWSVNYLMASVIFMGLLDSLPDYFLYVLVLNDGFAGSYLRNTMCFLLCSLYLVYLHE